MSAQDDFQHELLIVMNKIATSLDTLNENLEHISSAIQDIPTYDDDGVVTELFNIRRTINQYFE